MVVTPTRRLRNENSIFDSPGNANSPFPGNKKQCADAASPVSCSMPPAQSSHASMSPCAHPGTGGENDTDTTEMNTSPKAAAVKRKASTSPAPPTTAEITAQKFLTLLEDWLRKRSPGEAAQLTLDYDADVKPIHEAFAANSMDDLGRHLSLLFQAVVHNVELTRDNKERLARDFRGYCFSKTSGSHTLSDSSVTSVLGASQKRPAPDLDTPSMTDDTAQQAAKQKLLRAT